MKRLIDLTGRRIGMLTVLRRAPNYVVACGHAFPAWHVRCDCGREYVALSSNLRRATTHSCGCHRPGPRVIPKEIDRGPEWMAWVNAKTRCYNPNYYQRDVYGSRGIKMCDRWQEPNGQGFLNFMSDLGGKPNPKSSLDRIDTNGDYEPGNCRWVDWKTQQRNRRNNRILTVLGKSGPMAFWAEQLGMPYTTIQRRLDRGWPPELACLTPSHKYGK